MRHRLIWGASLAVAALLLVLDAPLAYGQVFPEPPIRFEHVRGPLSSYIVHQIFQDRRGFLWLASDHGLVRYDGYESVVYRFDPSDPAGLRTNLISSVAEAEDGRLWVGTADRLYRFDPATEEFELFAPHIWKEILEPSITSIVEDRQGRLWLGMLTWSAADCPACAGLLRIDLATGEWRRFLHDPADPTSLSHNRVRVVYEDERGTIWIGTWDGLNRYDEATGKFVRYRHDPTQPGSLAYNDVKDILEDREGRFWVGTIGGGLDLMDRESGEFEHFRHDRGDPQSLSSDYVMDLLEDHTGSIWVATLDAGLNRFDPNYSGAFARFRPEATDRQSLSNEEVLALYQSRDGVFWISSREPNVPWGALDRVVLRSPPFKVFPQDTSTRFGLGAIVVTALHQDEDGALWVGTAAAGVQRVDLRSGAVERFLHDPQDSASLSANFVTAIARDDSENLWVATDGGGLNRFKPESRTFTRHSFDPRASSCEIPLYVTGLLDDGEALWLAIPLVGLCRYDPRTGRAVRHTPSDPESAAWLEHLQRVRRDREGAIWIATLSRGLGRFDPATNELTIYAHDGADPASLSENLVSSIYEDARGVMWIGTGHGGLNRFNPETGSFTLFSEQNSGLPSNEITSILEGELPELWIASGSRLVRLNTVTREAQTYDMSRWYINFLSTSALQARDGELFYGGYGGLVSFYPSEINADPYPPQVVLTGFGVFDTSDEGEEQTVDLLGQLERTGGVKLAYDRNDISLTYVGIHFATPEANRYAYQLQGYDSKWRDVGARRTATYTNVPPGEYVFRVRAANRDGVWSSPTSLAAIRVTPPWWVAWWAYLLYAMFAGTILYAVRRYELNRVRLRNRLELERVEAESLRDLDQLKSRFFTNISHEFRTPLTLILGQVESALSADLREELQRKLSMVRRNARMLLQLVTQLLDLAKLETGRVELQAVHANVVPLLKSIVFSFESHAEGKRIELSLDTTHQVIELRYDPNVLERILVNLLANAFKFTDHGGTITVEVAVGPSEDVAGQEVESGPGRYVTIAVADTGRGIPDEHLPHVFDRFYQVEDWRHHQQGSGIGLSLARELVELHGGTISVHSRVGVGTRFEVRLPLEKKAGVSEVEAEAVATERAAVSPLAHEVTEWLSDSPVATETAASPGPHTGDIVLVVEDNADVRTYISDQLREGYQIVEAVDGEDGLSRAQEIIPDLIITDLMMPKIDGGQLCRTLRSDERTSHIPIIILTARASESSRIEGIETGADDYLIKPFSAAELRARVKNLIELRRLLRQRFSGATVIKPSEVAATDVDRAFLERVVAAIESFMGDESFNVGRLAEEVYLSESQLNRKLRALLDQTAGQLIRAMRLQRSADLLAQNAGTVAQIAYRVGFKDHAHFSRSFKERFGCAPSEYRHRGE